MLFAHFFIGYAVYIVVACLLGVGDEPVERREVLPLRELFVQAPENLGVGMSTILMRFHVSGNTTRTGVDEGTRAQRDAVNLDANERRRKYLQVIISKYIKPDRCVTKGKYANIPLGLDMRYAAPKLGGSVLLSGNLGRS